MKLKTRFKNIYNTRKNWNIVKNNPYLHQKFMYNAYRGVVVLIGIVIIFKFIQMIIDVSSGSNPLMTVITRAFMVLVGVMIILRLWNITKTLKTTLLHYETNPGTINNDLNQNQISTKDEIDNIIKKYDKKQNE